MLADINFQVTFLVYGLVVASVTRVSSGQRRSRTLGSQKVLGACFRILGYSTIQAYNLFITQKKTYKTGQGGPVVTVQSIRIGAERRGFNPGSVRQFLVRIGEEAGRISKAKLKQGVASSRPQQAVDVLQC
jgi:hypothetical protein